MRELNGPRCVAAARHVFPLLWRLRWSGLVVVPVRLAAPARVHWPMGGQVELA